MNQMIMALGAILLLGVTSLGINQILIDRTTTTLEAEASLNAVSIAQVMLDEIMTKSYDMATVSGARIYDSTLFTTPDALGPNATEASQVGTLDLVEGSKKYFNDVDDYNKYQRIASTPILGKFLVVDTVYYVNELYPDEKSSTQTNFKKIEVTVRHANMSYPLKISDIAVYRKYF